LSMALIPVFASTMARGTPEYKTAFCSKLRSDSM